MKNIILKQLGWIVLLNIIFTSSYFGYVYFKDKEYIKDKISVMFDGNKSVCGFEFYPVYDLYMISTGNALRVYNLKRTSDYSFDYTWFQCDHSVIRFKGNRPENVDYDKMLKAISNYIFDNEIDCKVKIKEVGKFRDNKLLPEDLLFVGELNSLNLERVNESELSVYNKYFEAKVSKHTTSSFLWFRNWEFFPFIGKTQMFSIPLSVILFFVIMNLIKKNHN